MKKTIFFICMLMACMTVCSSCANEAKKKYEAQKSYVDSLQKANEQAINRAMVTESETGILLVKLKCAKAEAEATDSLVTLAKEAFGDNSDEYKEAYNRKNKTNH